MRGATAHATGGVGQLGLDAPGTLAVPAAGPSGLRCGDLPWQIGVGNVVSMKNGIFSDSIYCLGLYADFPASHV